ncbi:hypothetical protein PsW64_04576 [Pseudovibrio sp. W64]|uniref:hypothetical protein n=1 Tax=unclassified Pseudovibrio TaxID=2627060 RepID=UPI000710181D|nr:MULTISPECIES: hypothetical protein [unclassified Pseudovibrio]KZK77398.1 hypothetical protein PsW64_04576 [Pseudovibrio sp. W64]KZK88100.1 hypothetical protein PsAD13_00045 [Pseudovibrio sp. Ad13]KZK96197.1 hypothetical protein PsAD46_00046 [Pseudovibrio sp. Ad46]KZL00991.1 hypothetical protein PsAD5_00835 [Pseudovibrio sp. Ad5]KZL20359.1 hypothetical protein PsWM33_04441 [Pseudovibrio sp. WM33]
MPPNDTFEDTLEKPLTVDDIDAAVSKLPIEVDPPAKIGFEQLLKDRQALSDDNTLLQNELMELKSRLATKQELDALIKPYAGKAYWFMCVYCGTVALILVLAGFKNVYGNSFNLADSVLEFLVGSTATTVIGLVGMVLTGIFVGARK